MNRILTTSYSSENYIPLRKAYYAVLERLLDAVGGESDHFIGLKPLECNVGLNEESEERKAEWVEFYVAALTAGMSLATLPDVTSCDPIDTTQIGYEGGDFSSSH